jgi:hypothetical protein
MDLNGKLPPLSLSVHVGAADVLQRKCFRAELIPQIDDPLRVVNDKSSGC